MAEKRPQGRPKREVFYRDLKGKMNSGFLMPGTRLIELDLASEYGVSRTIVREVMKQLAAEGMIDLVPYKGATVAKTSIRDLEEIYRIQQDLEGLAAYLATPRLSKKDISQLERVHQESKSHADGDAAQWQRWNTRFHRVLIENCGNRRLIKLVEGHQDQFARYWFLLLSIPGRIEQSIQEHKEIIKAVKAEDPERVRFLMEQHFQGAAERLLDIIRNVYPSSFTI